MSSFPFNFSRKGRRSAGNWACSWFDARMKKDDRNYLKSIFIHNILNGHTAPNLKEAFQSNNERQNTYNLRNTEIGLSTTYAEKRIRQEVLQL
jgi:hypothetical protein